MMSVLKEPLLKILGKTYAANEMLELTFGRYDLAIKTDNKGRAILLFLGHKDPQTGKIKGERFARRLVEDAEGNILKDHWDNKGKASAQF
ncbi:hypothetical protein [Pedobacter deserti]|uniref:hypothetical protein n=1 Tax=Pedobacter deserti TaxID=2817382 RepID=UPI00210DC074|nr:hypothetical protein [Pedobacter sp. SYSU D00382]